MIILIINFVQLVWTSTNNVHTYVSLVLKGLKTLFPMKIHQWIVSLYQENRVHVCSTAKSYGTFDLLKIVCARLNRFHQCGGKERLPSVTDASVVIRNKLSERRMERNSRATFLFSKYSHYVSLSSFYSTYFILFRKNAQVLLPQVFSLLVPFLEWLFASFTALKLLLRSPRLTTCFFENPLLV